LFFISVIFKIQHFFGFHNPFQTSFLYTATSLS